MEQNMFEICVKQLVKITLNKPVTTEFYNGTLFVCTITEDQARSIFHALSKSLGLGKVEIHPIGDTGEYAYDFV
jgi:hypothetical protein